jgi:hypothetical protein
MSWKVYERKWSWLNLRHYPSICWKEGLLSFHYKRADTVQINSVTIVDKLQCYVLENLLTSELEQKPGLWNAKRAPTAGFVRSLAPEGGPFAAVRTPERGLQLFCEPHDKDLCPPSVHLYRRCRNRRGPPLWAALRLSALSSCTDAGSRSEGKGGQ